MIADFRELRVYQTSFKAAMDIFELTRAWPQEEKYSLTSQIRRSSRGVCGNIGAAWRKRRYQNAFVSKMSDADEEAGETIIWLDFAEQCHYLLPEKAKELRDTFDHICAQLVTMINQADKWCGEH